jgi:hypothetical protein
VPFEIEPWDEIRSRFALGPRVDLVNGRNAAIEFGAEEPKRHTRDLLVAQTILKPVAYGDSHVWQKTSAE